MLDFLVSNLNVLSLRDDASIMLSCDDINFTCGQKASLSQECTLLIRFESLTYMSLELMKSSACYYDLSIFCLFDSFLASAFG